MKYILILITTIALLILPSLVNSTARIPGDEILGVWITEVKDAKVQVYRVGDTYYGKIIWLLQHDLNPKTPLLDNLNPNPKLRNRTRENIVALTGLIHCGDKKYNKGVIYYPTNGKTYGCNATIVDDKTIKLRVYLGFSLLGQSITFTKIQ